jgi:hypothetical protein
VKTQEPSLSVIPAGIPWHRQFGDSHLIPKGPERFDNSQGI